MKRRDTVTVALALLITATSAWASLDCANYISGEGPGGPMAGHLIGEQLVTEAFTFGVDAGVRAGLTGTIQYNVGYYKMTSGKVYRVDCRTYTAV
jgi:hypothetical protein